MFKGLNSRAYRVGGSVRDEIMGITPHDVDYVIEKCSIDEFRHYFPAAPLVGTKPNSPPVFLINGDEVALARIEEKTGDKYQDYKFSLDVSIEEDLSRRDFTINSIAKHYMTGKIVDPFGGEQDAKNRTLRCINPIAFIEDPLRIYRGARFLARFHLKIEPDTMLLMYENACNLIHVLPERVHLELEKVYNECDKPSSFFYFLEKIEALRPHFKPLFCTTKISAGPVQFHHGKTAFVHMMDSFDYAKNQGYSFDVALTVLYHDVGKGNTPKSILPKHTLHDKRSYDILKQYLKQHRFTAKQNDMILCFALNHMRFHYLEEMKPASLIRFYRLIKKYADEFIQCANCDNTPLNPKQIHILAMIERAIKDTVIDIPKTCKDPASFVIEKQSNTLRRYLNEKS